MRPATSGVPPADEGLDDPSPIPGTDDGTGWAVYPTLYEYAPSTPLVLAALADCGLAGTVAQIGSYARGQTLEFVVQQLVDYLSYWAADR